MRFEALSGGAASNLRFGVLFSEDRESIAAQEPAVGKIADLALLHFRARRLSSEGKSFETHPIHTKSTGYHP